MPKRRKGKRVNQRFVLTKYVGATDTKPSGIIAINMTSKKRKRVSWDHGLDPGDNHERAARMMLGNGHDFTGTLASAATDTGWVFTSRGKPPSGGML